MPLPTRTDLRDYLRIETTADDALIGRLLAQARAAVEAYIRQPIEERPVTLVIAPTFVGGRTLARRLVLPYAPVAGPVTVTHDDGTELLSGADFTANLAAGHLSWLGSGVGFDGGPYTVTVTAGLSLRPDYAEAIEPVMASAIIDWAADLYQRRNPAASYESGGGGVAVNYNETASKTMPSRIRVTLDPWRRMLV